MTTTNLDTVWESEIYSQGHHLNRYPFYAVVSFLFRYRPCHKSSEETDVLKSVAVQVTTFGLLHGKVSVLRVLMEVNQLSPLTKSALNPKNFLAI
jgi:hypothetical protein